MKTIASLMLVTALAGALVYLKVAFAQDPLRVNPDSVRVKLENNRVRVLESILQPGGKEKMHSHPAYVVYVVKGGKIRLHNADGKTSETELKAGDVTFRDPITHWGENVGTTEIDTILVELKSHE
jgi:quercetin dioxygenase-like cupin family protein